MDFDPGRKSPLCHSELHEDQKAGINVFMLYTLDEKTPVACNNGPEWQEWIEKSGDRRIAAQDDIGDFLVSTVFQGVDPIVPDSPTPLLFETMIYDGDGSVVGNSGLYPTWEMAQAGHRRAVLWVRNTSRANMRSDGAPAGRVKP
jgi:hypothetical protein